MTIKRLFQGWNRIGERNRDRTSIKSSKNGTRMGELRGNFPY
jgi:hypothetical protein